MRFKNKKQHKKYIKLLLLQEKNIKRRMSLEVSSHKITTESLISYNKFVQAKGLKHHSHENTKFIINELDYSRMIDILISGKTIQVNGDDYYRLEDPDSSKFHTTYYWKIKQGELNGKI